MAEPRKQLQEQEGAVNASRHQDAEGESRACQGCEQQELNGGSASEGATAAGGRCGDFGRRNTG